MNSSYPEVYSVEIPVHVKELGEGSSEYQLQLTPGDSGIILYVFW